MALSTKIQFLLVRQPIEEHAKHENMFYQCNWFKNTSLELVLINIFRFIEFLDWFSDDDQIVFGNCKFLARTINCRQSFNKLIQNINGRMLIDLNVIFKLDKELVHTKMTF